MLIRALLLTNSMISISEHEASPASGLHGLCRGQLNSRLNQCPLAPLIRPGIFNPSPPLCGLFRDNPGYSGIFLGGKF